MSWREIVAPIWVVGGLSICRWRDFFAALEEIVLKIALAAGPIYITIFILMFSAKPSYAFTPALLKNFENGELYLFCSSMLASIFYFSWKDRRGKPRYPNYQSHILIVGGMMAFSALIFAFNRAGVWLSPEVVISGSYFFFFVAFILVVLATTINNALNSNPAELASGATDAFAANYSAHRRGSDGKAD